MRRIAKACVVMLITGCASVGGGGPERDVVNFNVDIPVDSLIRIAKTQLQLHGYSVGAEGATTLMTQPRAVPGEVRAAANNRDAQQWVVRVDVGRETLTRRTNVRVRGFTIPDLQGQKTATQTTLTPITAANRRLFPEIEAVSGWISDAARRKAGSGQ